MATARMDNGNGIAARVAELRAAAPELTGVVLSTRSGLPLAADADGLDPDAVAALGAELLASAQAAALALAGGEPREASVRGPGAHLIALAVGDEAVLIALTDALTPTAAVLPDLREAAQELARALSH